MEEHINENIDFTTVYAKRNIPGYYVTFDSPIKFNNIGSTVEDFDNNMWVLIDEEHLEWKNNHPDATVFEVINMQMNEIQEDIEFIRNDIISKIKEYDSSQNVNDFTINNLIHAWITPAERSNYKNSIDSAKILNVENLSLYISDMPINISTVQAEQMLASIQLYADSCYIVTKTHIYNVSKLNNIEDIKNYDYTLGYPQKINFDI